MREFPAIEGLSLDQMQAEFVDLGHELSAVDARRKALLARMTKVRADAMAKSGLRRMTDDERAALRQELNKDQA